MDKNITYEQIFYATSNGIVIIGPQVMECLRTGKSELGHHIIGKKVDLVLDITLIHSRKKIKGAVCNFQERMPRALIKSLENKHLPPYPLEPSFPTKLEKKHKY